MRGGESTTEPGPERWLEHSNRKTAYSVIRGMDSRERVVEWIAWINQTDNPSEYRWALKALDKQASVLEG